MEKYIFKIGIAAVVVGVCAPYLVTAAEIGGGTPQSYAADRRIDAGTIVRLAEQSKNTVTWASKKEPKNMLGVVIDPSQLSFRISDDKIKNQTYVASSGTYPVLVSTQNGNIASGDYLALSSLDGIVMKSTTEDSTVLGRAMSDFDGRGTIVGSSSLKDDKGQTKKVNLGSIPASIAIAPNPQKESTKVNVPNFLERVGLQIAEKEVNPIRIYLSAAIATVSLIAAIAVLVSGVRNSVISIGRNPMSKKSIFRALFEIILTSALIVIIGIFAVYLLLRL